MLATTLATLACAAGVVFPAPPQQPATENVIFVMTDGLRWQEVFSGADKVLLDPLKNQALSARYWRDSPEARRRALMPFLWSTVSANGQIYGNRKKGSNSKVANPHKFSYPGYNETLTGFVDPAITSNDYVPNKNVTVFEWLLKRPGFRGSAAAFGAWNVISAVFNKQRCGFLVNAGFEPLGADRTSSRLELLERMRSQQPKVWESEPFDVFTFQIALEYMKLATPRLLYISLGETDEWAHANDYGKYLNAANRFDAYLKELWDTVKLLPQYRGKTTLVLTVDHGRGELGQWTSHGASVPDSEYTWMAFLGPDTPARGEMMYVPPVTNGRIAATIAKLLGYDYAAAQPKAGKPIDSVFKRAE